MQFPKLTPLQSRFAACLGTTLLLLLIYFSLNPSHFAYAAELASQQPPSHHNADHNHHRITLAQELDLDWGGDVEEDGDVPGYEAAFGVGVGPSIVGRQTLDMIRLRNNAPNTLNLVEGETQTYVFMQEDLDAEEGSRGTELPTTWTGQGASRQKSKRSVEVDELKELVEKDEAEEVLERRQTTVQRTVYLSANTCLQPLLNENATGTPGQPTIYISRTSTNQRPDASNNDGFQQLEQGYAALAVENVTENLFISISAPTLPNDTFTGPWSYQIAASTDDYYHYYNNRTTFMWTIDTDSTSALLSTYNLTSQDGSNATVLAQREAWMGMTNDPPFDIYVFNSSSPKIDGIQRSYCGLSKLNMEFMRINSSISQRGVGSNPKQQFHMQSLVAGNTYFSVLAYRGGNATENSATVGGGGQVWKSMQFTTKSGSSCFLPSYLTSRVSKMLIEE
jgi:calcium channel MID1